MTDESTSVIEEVLEQWERVDSTADANDIGIDDEPDPECLPCYIAEVDD